MRAFKVEIRGFKRLANVSCNVDGKMIAFLGPNEAGKSSVLQALSWFSEPGSELPRRSLTRGKELTTHEPVVRVRYVLEPDDVAVVDDLLVTSLPKIFIAAKYANGDMRYGFDPQPSRLPDPFVEARRALEAFSVIFPGEAEADARSLEDDEVKRLIDATKAFLEDVDATWDDDWTPDFESLIDFLNEEIKVEGERVVPRASNVAEHLIKARDVLRTPHPRTVARQRLRQRVPQFAFFDEAERMLQPSYDLSLDALRDEPPAALANLLWIAELDLHAVWDSLAQSDTTRTRTMERQANERLRQRLGPKWRQERLDVELNISGTLLEILIAEGHATGSTTAFDERSDGLRMFVALVAFLARHEYQLPPVLLVDEIETHLHLDAQADLVEVLTNDVGATQVFYSTHSPGSLPRDLGTGLRLVQPDPADRSFSELRNDFWTSGPGFAPVLFAMGAGAAAFSALRRAVFCEGPSDMILLPSLFRASMEIDDVGFQIAQGISSYNGSMQELEDVASRVAYLLDGDEGGVNLRTRLEERGVATNRIVQLDVGMAAEDYVLRDRYLEVVNDLLKKHTIAPDELDSDSTVSLAVDKWCKQNGISAPGKTAVASALVRDKEKLLLADGSREKLASVYTTLLAVLEAKS